MSSAKHTKRINILIKVIRLFSEVCSLLFQKHTYMGKKKKKFKECHIETINCAPFPSNFEKNLDITVLCGIWKCLQKFTLHISESILSHVCCICTCRKKALQWRAVSDTLTMATYLLYTELLSFSHLSWVKNIKTV